MNTSLMSRPQCLASVSWFSLIVLILSIPGGVRSATAANDWSLRGGPEGGFVGSGAVDPFDSNVVYVTNYSGVFKTTNGGTNWTSLNAYWGAGTEILIDPANPNTVYLVGGQIIKSTDGGSHWTILDTKKPCTDFVSALVIDPKNTSTLYAIMFTSSGSVADYYVLKSTDGGSNWTRMTWKAYTLAVDPSNSSVLYAATTAGLQKTTDGGNTWTPAGTGLPSTGGSLGTVVVDPKAPATLYLVADGTTVYKSMNSGGQWSISNTGINGVGLKNPVIDPVNTGTLYEVAIDATSALGVIYKTTNGGGQWSQLNVGIPTASPQFVALGASNTAALFSGTVSHGVLKSIDSGASWATKNNGLKANDNLMVLDPTNKNNIYLGVNGLGVFQSTDGGNNWTSRNSGLPSLQVAGLAISPVNPQILYVSLNDATQMSLGGVNFSFPGIFKSTNGAASWTATASPADNFGFLAPQSLATDPGNANGIYAAGYSTGVYHSTDGGSSWSVSPTGLPTTGVPYALVIDPQTPTILYLGILTGTASTQFVYKSTDSGTTWNPSGSGLPGASGVWDLVIDPKNPSTLYAAVLASQTVNGGVYKSMDSGASWTAANNGLSNFNWESFYSSYFDNLNYSGGVPICASFITLSALRLAIDPVNPATLFSVVDGIVFRSTDAAGTWNVAHSGLFFSPNAIRVSQADHTTVYAASQGVFIFNGSSGGGGTTSITVGSPNGGESWVVGSTHNITWTTTGTVGNVKIEYSTDGGTTYTTIVASTANTGSYSWAVPNTPSNSVKIRISDVAGTVSDTSDGNFAITSGTGCTYSLSSTSKSFSTTGGTGSVNVTAGSGCAWTATSNAPWITITSGATGSGNGTVNYSVAPSGSGSLRTGTITIAGQTFTVTEGQSSGISTDLFVPIVLSSGGAGGSFYTTELTADNKGTATAEVDFTYTGAAALGGGSGTASISLPPGQMIIPDSITYLVNHGVPLPSSGNRGGTLRAHFSNLGSSSDASITARTTTLVKDSGGSVIGRAGLAYSAIPVSSDGAGVWDYIRRIRKAITEVKEGDGNHLRGAGLSDSVIPGSAVSTTSPYICGLRQNTTDRSNVAFQNVGAAGDGSITLQATVFDGNTSAPHVLPPIVLDPGAFTQISGVLGSNGLSLTNGYIKVERTAGTAPYYAYGVINDQVNSDGSFVIPQPSETTPVAGLALPVIVQTSAFISELDLTNFSTQARTINFVFYAEALTTADKTARFSITVPAGQQQIIPNIFDYMRSHAVAGVGPAGTTIAGALFATATGGDISGVVVGARTSAAGVGVGGRFGLFYTAVPYGQASTSSAWIFGLQQNSENRSNLAIVNTGETDANSDTFVVDLYDGATGTKVKSLDPIVLKAHGWIQIGTVLNNAPGVQQGYAEVRRTSGANPFITYGVINDGAGPGQRTGDGAYIGSIGD